MFRQCLKVKEIITPNTFRNSFACHMLNNGVTTETVQNLLGHKTRISTERYKDILNAKQKYNICTK